MSRSGWSDDWGDDFPGQTGLFRGNVDRSIGSKKGQQRLRELKAALEAMPIKELAREVFLQSSEACALGVWADHHIAIDATKRGELAAFNGDDDDTADMLGPSGWPRLVVKDVVYENDREMYLYNEVEGPQVNWSGPHGPVRYRRDETAAERYTRVLEWVNERIVEVK